MNQFKWLNVGIITGKNKQSGHRIHKVKKEERNIEQQNIIC